MRTKVTRQSPQTTTFEEKGEPKRIRTEVPLLTSLRRHRWAQPAHGVRCGELTLVVYCWQLVLTGWAPGTGLVAPIVCTARPRRAPLPPCTQSLFVAFHPLRHLPFSLSFFRFHPLRSFLTLSLFLFLRCICYVISLCHRFVCYVISLSLSPFHLLRHLSLSPFHLLRHLFLSVSSATSSLSLRFICYVISLSPFHLLRHLSLSVSSATSSLSVRFICYVICFCPFHLLRHLFLSVSSATSSLSLSVSSATSLSLSLPLSLSLSPRFKRHAFSFFPFPNPSSPTQPLLTPFDLFSWAHLCQRHAHRNTCAN